MADKDLGDMLRRMHPVIDRWYFTDLPTARAETAEGLMEVWQQCCSGQGGRVVQSEAQVFSSPQQALQAAIAAADPADRIVVFGSFLTVGEVLREPLPRLSAPHVAD